MRARTFEIVTVSLLLSAGVLAQAPGDRPVFRSGIELVQIDVSVLDGKRQPVRGLTAADFTVLENGAARPVRTVAEVVVPAPVRDTDAVWASTVPSDVATNETGAQDGRLVVILMDRTIPLGQPTLTARRIAEAAIAQLGPHDLGAVISTSGGVPQTFTADKERLRRAVAQRDWSTDMSIDSRELLQGLSDQSVGLSLAPDPLSDGRCLCGLCVLDTISRVADAMKDASARRKTVLFIGSSLIVQAPPRDPKADVGCDRLLRDARTKMFDALALSSVTIHSLDPTGVSNISPVTRASSPVRAGRVGDVQAEEVNDALANQESLGILPDRTGGRRVINTNAPEDKVADIFHESDSYYVLAYEPAPAASGTPRSLEIKVNRKGVQAYTQRRVPPVRTASAAPPAPPTLDAGLQGLLPSSVRPLSINLVAAAGLDADRPTVTMHVDALSFVEGRTTSAPLEIAIAAVDAFGRRVAGARQTSTVTLLGGTGAGRPPEAPIESRLDLPAGDYEIRVAVRDPASGVVSSVFAPVKVPSFAKAPFSMSDVTIESAASESAAPQATIRRAFRGTERLAATVHFYAGLDRDTDIAPVAVRTRILDAAGRPVQDQTTTLTAANFARRRADFRAPVPIADLPAGAYLLRLDATSGASAASRAVRFRVN